MIIRLDDRRGGRDDDDSNNGNPYKSKACSSEVMYKVVQIWPGLRRLVYTQIIPDHIWTTLYTGCNRRNGPDFGRVFLMLNYKENPPKHLYPKFNGYGDIGQRKYGLLWCLHTVICLWRHTRLIWGMGPAYLSCIPTLSLETAERPWLSQIV